MKKHVQPITPIEYVVALDIGTTKIATIVGFLNDENKIEILGFGKCDSSGVEYGAIRNIMKTIDCIKLSKQLATNNSGKEISNAYVGIAGRHIQSRMFKHHIIRKNGQHDYIIQEEIDSMIQELYNVALNPGETIIDVIPQYYLIDGEKVDDPIGYLGVQFEGYFQLIIVNESQIRNIIRCSKDADIYVNNIILEPLASASVCLTSQEKELGTLLVDIGGGTTDLAIYRNGNPVYTKVIPIGGYLITKDIATVCKITDEVAEKIKIKFGNCIVDNSNKNNTITIPQFIQQEPIKISEPYLAEIIYYRVQSIIECMKTFLKEAEFDNAFKNIVITGGGSNLKGICSLFNYSFRVPCRIGIPEIGFTNSIPVELKQPIFSTGMGLLKYGLEKELKSSSTNKQSEEDYIEVTNDKKRKSFKQVISDYFDSLGEKMS